MDTLETPTQSTRRWKGRSVIALGLVLVLAAAAGIAWAAGVGPASDAQEQQIAAIVDSLFAKHQAMAAVHQQMHQQLLAALTGPTVDRAAIEAVRAGAITLIDQGSKDLAKSVGDIADVLTPAQRQQLAALAKEHMQQ